VFSSSLINILLKGEVAVSLIEFTTIWRLVNVSFRNLNGIRCSLLLW